MIKYTRLTLIYILLVIFTILPLSPVLGAEAPSVNTNSASDITSTTASLVGNLISMGSASGVEVYFEYGKTITYGSTTSVQVKNTTGSFTANITGLSTNSTYHFRAIADGGAAGTSTGQDMTFTTWTPPKAETKAASSVSGTKASLNGELLSMGTAGSINIYFEYGTTTSYGNITSAQSMTYPNTISVDVQGLSPGVTYHFRIKADGGVHGIATGKDMTFYTTPVTPVIRTDYANELSYTSASLHGYLMYLGTADSVIVSCEYGPTTEYGSTTSTQTYTGTALFSLTAYNLLPGTTYHFRAKADGGVNGVGYGDDMTFKTSSATSPALAMATVKDIGFKTATLVGNISSLGTASSVTIYFEYGTTSSYGTTATLTTSPSGVGEYGGFTAEIEDLLVGTLYHYRAVADGGVHGTAVTDDQTFVTAGTGTASSPTLITSAATGIDTVSASLSGDLTYMGTSTRVNVYFQYGTTTDYGSSTPLQEMTSPGTASVTITGLQPGAVYHYRIVADIGESKLYTGADVSFTTLTSPPQISTLNPTDISNNTVTLVGSVNSLGSAQTINVYFDYGTTETYGLTTTIQQITATGTFTANVSGLKPGVTYHFRAIAESGVHGIVTGEDKSFVTTSTPDISVVPGSIKVNPEEATPGQSVFISATVRNSGGSTGNYQATLKINDFTEETQEVTIDAGKSHIITFTVVKDDNGTYQIDINGAKGIFTINGITSEETTVSSITTSSNNNGNVLASSQLFIIIAVAVIILICIVIYVIRRFES